MNGRQAAAAALVLALGLAAGGAARAQDAEAKKALERYRALRPTAEDLIMYRLDWAESFEAAKERAVKEKRPVLVVAIHARYGDLFTGHC